MELKFKKTKKPSTFNSQSSTKKGFTLIELMVASSIFIIVMVISIGAVLSIVDANRKAQSLNSVITNLNFAVESMVRDLREGTKYDISECSTSPCSAITFHDSNDQIVSYEFTKNPQTGIGSIVKRTPTFVSAITASEVNIQSISFYVNGNAPDDGEQPNVLFVLSGIAGVNLKTQSTYKLQTLITQRILDS